MSNAREIFGAHECDSGHHESDAEDHESDARFSGSHGMFGSSDRLFVGDLDGELAMLAGGDFHGNFALHGGDLHASSIPDAPRCAGAGLNTRAGDELPERSADCLEGVGAAHAALPMAATAPHVRRSTTSQDHTTPCEPIVAHHPSSTDERAATRSAKPPQTDTPRLAASSRARVIHRIVQSHCAANTLSRCITSAESR